MKSYKVAKPPTDPKPPKPKHSTTLADLEDRRRLHKKLNKKKGPGVMGVLKALNKTLNSTSHRMPNDKEFSDWMWK